MTIEKHNIEHLPFFHSFIPDAPTKAVIDIREFNLWLQRVHHLEFLSDSEEAGRAEAYKELENGEALDLKDAMKEW